MAALIVTNALWVLCIIVNIYPNSSYNIKQAFEQNEVVPDVVPQAPTQFLKVTYANGMEVFPGAELTPTQVKSEPAVEWEAQPSAYYTLIMTDPDAPSRSEPKFREFKHWLVGNIPGHDVSEGEVLAAYRGSGPPQGTGLHRYVFLLYKQPGKIQFNEERVGNNSSNGRPKFRAADFAQKYGLGEPVAGNLFQAQWEDVPTVH